MSLATQIQEARKLLNFTQSQAATAWGVPLRTLQEWEHSRRIPRGLSLLKLKEIIADALKAAKLPPLDFSAPTATAAVTVAPRKRGRPPKAKLPPAPPPGKSEA